MTTEVTFTATQKPRWKLDDATLFPLILLVLGPVPEKGWKFRDDRNTSANWWTPEARQYKRDVDQYLYDNHYQHAHAYNRSGPRAPDMVFGPPWTFVAQKRNQFMRWVWNTRYQDVEVRERIGQPRKKWADD